jgi:ubiquinone/menaquinone biosynthesis C-methylase UbiE
MANEAYILKHYKKVAENFGLNGTSTIQDPYIRSSEINFFLQELSAMQLPDNFSLIDLGGGNGYLLSKIREQFPRAKLFGLEFTPELYELAQSRKLSDTEIIHGSIKDQHLFQENSFDIIITERVIINLLSWKQQSLALSNIAYWLKDHGHYLMSESFREPWQELNQARREMAIPEVPISKHNRYLTKNLPKYMNKIGLSLYPSSQLASNFLSTHFYITRVMHPFIKPNGGRKKESHFATFFDQALPAGVGNYSPILFYHYLK